jgi:hypothetical protein
MPIRALFAKSVKQFAPFRALYSSWLSGERVTAIALGVFPATLSEASPETENWPDEENVPVLTARVCLAEQPQRSEALAIIVVAIISFLFFMEERETT